MEIPSSPPISYPNDVVSEAEVDSSLPIDMIIEILARLPVKSLCKFKCVSKKFLELITDPHFICTHRELSLSNPNILLMKKTHLSEVTIKLDFCGLSFDGFCKNHEFSVYIYEEAYVKILPSKWGLIWLICESGFYACNPSRQLMVKLPKASYSKASNASIGYIKARDEYVLMYLFGRRQGGLRGEVLRLRDGMDCSWKMVKARLTCCARGRGVSVENVLYWIGGEEGHYILSFDLEKEKFNTLPIPEGCLGSYRYCLLIELGGRLCFADNTTRPPIIDIWVLTDIANNKWVKEYSIQTSWMFSYDKLCCIVPFAYRDGRILLDAHQESLDYYDTKEKKYMKIMDHRITGRLTWCTLYTESLFSLKQMDLDG